MYSLFDGADLLIIPIDFLLEFSDQFFQSFQLNLFLNQCGIFLQCTDIVFTGFDFPMKHTQTRNNIQSVFNIHIHLRIQRPKYGLHSRQTFFQFCNRLTQQISLLFCLQKLYLKRMASDKRNTEDLRLNGTGHTVLVPHAFSGNGCGILFQILVALAHLDFSQHHIDISTGISVFGSYHGSQRTLRRFLVFFHLLGIDKAYTVRFFLSAQSVIDTQGDIKALRFHQNIKTLCIQISLNGISPLLILNFQQFAKHIGLRFASYTRKFLFHRSHHPLHTFGISQFFLFQPVDLPIQLLPLLPAAVDFHLDFRHFSLKFSIHGRFIPDHLFRQLLHFGYIRKVFQLFQRISIFPYTGIHIRYLEKLSCRV